MPGGPKLPPPGKAPPPGPFRELEALDTVRATLWPTATLSTSELSTESSTVYLPVLTTVICAELPVEPCELSSPVGRPPLPDEPMSALD